MRTNHLPRVLAFVAAGALGAAAVAVDLPHTFTPDTTISSSEVNENFAALDQGKQERVSEGCEVGSTIRAINEDGSVECDSIRAFHAERSDGPDDISASPSYTTIVSTTLPAGNYVVNAKAVLADTEGADPFLATVRCTVFSGNDIVDTYAVTLSPPDEGAAVLAMQGVATTRGGSTTLRLACRKGGDDTTAVGVSANPRLTAIQVGSIE